MGIYNPRRKPKEVGVGAIHPVWRGIGCIMMILIPIMSFVLADVIIEANITRIGIPRELRGTVNTVILGWIRFFWAKVLVGGIITVALFAVQAFFYSVLYRFSGGSNRGPMDAPPIRHKVKKRDR